MITSSHAAKLPTRTDLDLWLAASLVFHALTLSGVQSKAAECTVSPEYTKQEIVIKYEDQERTFCRMNARISCKRMFVKPGGR